MSDVGAVRVSRESYFERVNKELILLPLRIIAVLTAVSGMFALLFEVKYFADFSIELYFGRLLATTIAFAIFATTFYSFGKNKPVQLIHVLLLTIILSFGSIIYLIPETVVLNSQILALVIFTVALFLSWEIKHQIIVAIYYNLVFATSILLNDQSVYFLPNLFETVLFVSFISLMGIVASSINYKLRKDAIYKQFEAARTEERYKSIFDNSIDGIFQLSADNKFLTVNNSFSSLLGFSETDEMLGLDSVESIFRSKDEYSYFRDILDNQGKVKNFRQTLRKKNGQALNTKMNVVTVKDEEGNILHYEGFIQDITKQLEAENERNQALNELREAKQKADLNAKKAIQANNTKTRFLIKINHDLRVPMNNVLGYLELIESDGYRDDTDLKKLASVARVSADEIMELLGDNIDIAKIESGKLDLETREFEVKSEMEKVISLLSSKADNKKIRLSYIIDESVPPRLAGDPARLRQIIVNLAGNAVKFTEEGSVGISLRSEEVEDDKINLIVRVKDTGSGIAEKDIPNIFNPFSQSSLTRKKSEGAGIGLMICKELVKLMDGQIRVKSLEGKGSIFEFNVKLEAVKEKVTGENFEKAFGTMGPINNNGDKENKKNILLAEDNEYNRNIETKILTNAGYNVIAAENGRVALEKIKENRIDLILMDMQMDEMDGLTATKKIKQMNEFASIPIIALTAHSSMEDRQRCLAAGINDYVEKPISIRFLKMIIDKWLEE